MYTPTAIERFHDFVSHNGEEWTWSADQIERVFLNIYRDLETIVEKAGPYEPGDTPFREAMVIGAEAALEATLDDLAQRLP